MTSSSGDREPNVGEIRLWEADGWWIAKDPDTGIASQGETRETALENLDEAVRLSREARDAATPAPESDVPWFESS